MFKNLKAEMIRQNVTIKDISKILDIKDATARLKVNGKITIRYSECEKISKLFSENNSVDYLFAR